MNGGQPPVDPTATTMVGLTLRRTRKEFIIVTFRPGPSMMWEHWWYKSVVALEEVLSSSFGLLFSYLDQLTKAIHELPKETLLRKSYSARSCCNAQQCLINFYLKRKEDSLTSEMVDKSS